MKSAPVLFLIDDDAVDQEIFRRALDAEAIDVDLVVIGTGDGASQRVREVLASKGAGDAALVMLDLNMPGENGFEVLAQLRAEPMTRFTPVVVFTTSSDREDVSRAYALGASSYVVKPGSLADLRRALRIVTDYWFGVAIGTMARVSIRPG